MLVTIATTAQAEPFLTTGTQFWVVKPRLFAGNISGFSTLLSGCLHRVIARRCRRKSRTQLRRSRGPAAAG